MTTALTTPKLLTPVSQENRGKLQAIQAALLTAPQVDIATDHVIHGGMYARTITIPAGIVLTGAFIKLPTVLIANGNASVFVGDRWVSIEGYHVLAAAAGRKQVFIAHEDTQLTMIFPTDATTIEQAEDEFTDEAELLFSRKPDARNTFNITGE